MDLVFSDFFAISWACDLIYFPVTVLFQFVLRNVCEIFLFMFRLVIPYKLQLTTILLAYGQFYGSGTSLLKRSRKPYFSYVKRIFLKESVVTFRWSYRLL